VSAEPPEVQVLILEDSSGQPVELDLRAGPQAAVEAYFARTAAPARAPRPGRGRPKLGVVAREVTLLPRHWEWLAAQPGGASAALRRLVEEARRSAASTDEARQAQTTLYRAMSALAGDLPGFEEAARHLFAGDEVSLLELTARWPPDVAAYMARLVSTWVAGRGALASSRSSRVVLALHTCASAQASRAAASPHARVRRPSTAFSVEPAAARISASLSSHRAS
jgi:hypothetical protein